MARCYSMKKLTEKVHEIRDLERMISDLTTRVDQLKKEIKEDMSKRGVTELAGEDWRVNWSTYSKDRFDQSSFKSSHPKLYEKYVVAQSQSRFTVR